MSNMFYADGQKVFLAHKPLIVGEDNVVVGARIWDVVRKETTSMHHFNYMKSPNKYLEKITEEFWDNYIEYGRCYLDKDHCMFMSGDNYRYTATDNNHKLCNWCGEEFKKVSKMIETREYNWISMK